MEEIKKEEQVDRRKTIEVFPTYEIIKKFEINNEEYAICKKRYVKSENKTTRKI